MNNIFPSLEPAKAFFLSWGLCPSKENKPMDIGNGAGECVINARCYERMCNDAEDRFGRTFRNQVSKMVDATDGEFYLVPDTWDDLEKYLDVKGN